jgi:hypothetical protein
VSTRARATLACFLALACWLAADSASDRTDSNDADRLWAAELERLAAELGDLSTDFARTTHLREYVGQLLDVGRPDRNAKETYGSVDFESYEPAEFFPLYRANKLPANCGYTTYFYIKLLQTFGYKAYQYSFGFTEPPYERFIHSVALVEIRTDEDSRLVVQDPYLNLTYRTRDGEPVDFIDFLSMIKTGQSERIVQDAGSVTTALLVPDVSLYYPHLSARCRTLMAEALTRSDGSIAREIPITRDYATLMQSPCDDFEGKFTDALRKNGFDERLLYAYTLRASEIVGSSDRIEVQRRIDSVIR